MKWSPDGSVLASAGADHRVSLWDTKSGAEVVTWDAHNDEIRRLAWHPSGTILATSGGKRDPRALLWNVQTGLPVGVLSGHTQEIVGLFWAADAAWLATASADRTLRVWNAGAPVGEQSGLAFHVESAPHCMDGARKSGLIALGRSDLLIQVLQFAS
jgi:WD40 repeat protein